MSKSLLAIPKGRLYEGISNLFEEIEIILPPADSRQYYYPDFQKDCSLYITKPKAIPELMHAGIADFCLCGLDIMKNNVSVVLNGESESILFLVNLSF